MQDALITQRIEKLDGEIKKVKKQLSTMPGGELFCAGNGKYVKWWKVDENNKREYLPKKKRKEAEELALKKYLKVKLEDLERERYALHRYKSLLNPGISKADSLLSKNPYYAELIYDKIPAFTDDMKKWTDAAYETNPYMTEKLIHKTISGHAVRSKSEQLIDNALFTHGIPTRYECALKLGEQILYPDFTSVNPINGEVNYWEHLGMMDNPKYVNDAYEKLRLYNSYGIIQGINLIITSETKNNPLTSERIEKTIEMYFE